MHVRVPLQFGRGAVRALALGTLGLTPSVAALVGSPAIASAIAPKRPSEFAAYGATPHADPHLLLMLHMMILLGGTLGVLGGLASLRRAFERRPSDLLIDEAGLSFEGGPHHGFALEWRDVEPGAWRVVSRRGVWRLLGSPDVPGEDPFVVAESSDLREAQALRATCTAVKSFGATPAEPTVRPVVLACAGCGAPLVPTDAPTATCPFCQVVTPVAQEVRARVRLEHERRPLRSADDEAVALLLSQPSATSAGRLLGAVAGVLVAASLGCFGLLAVRYVEGSLTPAVGAMCVAFPMATLAGLACIALAVVGRREALHVVTLAIGAIAPSAAWGGWACRRCGGPLSLTGGLGRCPHCGAHNVVGLGLASQLDGDDDIIPAALARRGRQRLQAYLVAVVGVLLLAIAVVGAKIALAR